MKADCVSMVLDFLGKRVRQPSEPPHAHAHGQILPLNVARRDMVRVWVASAAECLSPVNLRWAVPTRRMRNLAIELNELGIIYIGTKPGLDCLKISAIPIAGDLDSVRQPFREITDKLNS